MLMVRFYIVHHLEKYDKQYGTNFWEGETFSCLTQH